MVAFSELRVTNEALKNGTDMPERQITETQEPASDPSWVSKNRGQGWGSDDAKVDAIRATTLYQGSENPQEAISTMGWLSASILHDLRNPLGTIVAGAELLMDLDSPSTQVKRLAANMCRAAGRMRQLLADLASIARDNVSTAETCDIREVIRRGIGRGIDSDATPERSDHARRA